MNSSRPFGREKETLVKLAPYS
ncbi:unnamed protein product, partial [Adineta ricciae]